MTSARPLLAGALAVLVSCSRQPDDIREWRASDHDHTESPTSGQVSPSDAGSSVPGSEHGLDEVTFAAWKQNCVTCHGPIGRGDGPQGPMVQAPDLSRKDWQASVSDQQIARVILEGRGRMPSFSLPKPTVDALVKLVRLLGGQRPTEASAVAAGADSPSDSDAAAPTAGGRQNTRDNGAAAPASSPRTSTPLKP